MVEAGEARSKSIWRVSSSEPDLLAAGATRRSPARDCRGSGPAPPRQPGLSRRARPPAPAEAAPPPRPKPRQRHQHPGGFLAAGDASRDSARGSILLAITSKWCAGCNRTGRNPFVLHHHRQPIHRRNRQSSASQVRLQFWAWGGGARRSPSSSPSRLDLAALRTGLLRDGGGGGGWIEADLEETRSTMNAALCAKRRANGMISTSAAA